MKKLLESWLDMPWTEALLEFLGAFAFFTCLVLWLFLILAIC